MTRSPYTFANINFIGECNQRCLYCLGNELIDEVKGIDNMSTHFDEFPNLPDFLDDCRSNDVKQLYLTGLNTDPLLYEHLVEFIAWLKREGFYVGMRTNGIGLNADNMDIINSLTTCARDAVGYSILSWSIPVRFVLGGHRHIPDWEWICQNTHVPFRISHVVTTQTCMQLNRFIEWAAAHRPEYIQLRRVASQRPEMIPHQEAYDFVAKRLLEYAKIMRYPIDAFEAAYQIHWRTCDVTLWPTVDTTVNSLNYFTDGRISDDYFVIKGYRENRQYAGETPEDHRIGRKTTVPVE